MKILIASIVGLILPLFMLPVSAASESGAETKQALTIGIFPRRDPLVTIRLFKPLQVFLEKELGVPVKLETAASFQRFESNLQSQRYDLVHFNQYHYIQAHKQLGYEVIAQNEEFGEKTIRGAIFVRRDSGITSVRQLKDKTVLFGGGQKAMVSYIIPRYLLLKQDIRATDIKERFARSPPDALLALYQKQVVASGAGSVATRMPLVTGKIDSSQLFMLAQSAAVSHLPWAVKGDMDSQLKHRIRQLLIGLKDSDEGRPILEAARLDALNPAEDSDYDEHRAIIKAVSQSGSGL